ncbi:hypothetical protein PHLCEN_2v11361 [Hermanssonia centrifuga]|uniref:Uncharacterized protein n=1 Tax=Hermanssonia centrifuga TaxID=98765 RepID=A0A2R6NL87_9APHY|nr:hypothetical protein PHLCEN_2v11361 [Hermanssonia centrifuga]
MGNTSVSDVQFFNSSGLNESEHLLVMTDEEESMEQHHSCYPEIISVHLWQQVL